MRGKSFAALLSAASLILSTKCFASAYLATLQGQTVQLSLISPSVLDGGAQQINFIFDNRDTVTGAEVHIDSLEFTITQGTPGSTVNYNIHRGTIVDENNLHAWRGYANREFGGARTINIFLSDGVHQIGPTFCFVFVARGKGGNGTPVPAGPCNMLSNVTYGPSGTLPVDFAKIKSVVIVGGRYDFYLDEANGPSWPFGLRLP